MNKIQEINDVCKETLSILAYFDDELIKKIPAKVFNKLIELSADSQVNFYIDKEKDLDKQDISEESKNLISVIYYSYIADENEKQELLKSWNENENNYQEDLREKYNIDNMFKNTNKTSAIDNAIKSESNALVEYKESIFRKIINNIKKYITRR